MTTAPIVELTPIALPRVSGRPTTVPSWSCNELRVGAIVYHPQHRVGIIQMVDGSMRFVAFIAANDRWVRSSELIEERYFGESLEVRPGNKLDRSEPPRPLPEELKNGYPMHSGFHTQIWPRIFSWVHSQAQPKKKDPNYKYWKQVIKTSPALYTGETVEHKGDISDAYSGVSVGARAKRGERYNAEEQMLVPTASANVIKERETLFLYRYFRSPLLQHGFRDLKSKIEPWRLPFKNDILPDQWDRWHKTHWPNYFYLPSENAGRAHKSWADKLDRMNFAQSLEKYERVLKKLDQLDDTVSEATPFWIRWYGQSSQLVARIYRARIDGNRFSDYIYPYTDQNVVPGDIEVWTEDRQRMAGWRRNGEFWEPELTDQEFKEVWNKVKEAYRQQNLTDCVCCTKCREAMALGKSRPVCGSEFCEIGWVFYPNPDGCCSQTIETVWKTTVSEPTTKQQIAKLERAEALINKKKPELELIREVIEGKKTQEEAAAQLGVTPGAYRALQSRVLNSNDPWDLVVTGDELDGIYAVARFPHTPISSHRICHTTPPDNEIVAGFYRVVNEILSQWFKNKSRTKSFVCTCGALKNGRPTPVYFKDGRKRHRFDRIHSHDCAYDFQLYEAAEEIRDSLLRHPWRTLPKGDHTAAEYARSKASSITPGFVML